MTTTVEKNTPLRLPAMPSHPPAEGELVVLDFGGTPVRFEVKYGKAWVFLAELVALCGYRRFQDILSRLVEKNAARKSTADEGCTVLQSNVAEAGAVVAILERSRKAKAAEMGSWLRDEVVPALLGHVTAEPVEASAKDDESTGGSRIFRIPFHGGEVLAVDVDGKPYVVLKPIVEGLGLSYSRQLKKLKSSSWACMALRAMQLPGDTQRREHVVVDLRTLFTLLANVEEGRVAPEKRPALIAYQNEVADAVEAYWMQGVAVNLRHAASVGQASGLSADLVLQAVREAVREEFVSRVEAYENELQAMRDRLDAVAGAQEWTTAAKYARRHGLEAEARDLSRLAGKAREVAHEHGLVPLVSEAVGLPPVVHLPDWAWAEAVERLGLGPERKAG